jgi:hypothetical protein
VKKRLSDQYKAVAKSANVPRDLMTITDSSDEVSMTETGAKCNSPSTSTSTTNINFNELVTSKNMIRENIETTAVTGQQKQPVQVKQGRHWNAGENLPKDTVYTLKLSRDRNKIGIKKLPVVITQVVKLQETDQL